MIAAAYFRSMLRPRLRKMALPGCPLQVPSWRRSALQRCAMLQV